MNINNMNTNINYVEETDYSITPDNALIWYGELPFKEGSKFPTDTIKMRASKYATYKKLYLNEYDEVFKPAIQIQSVEQDLFSYFQNYDLVTSLPDFRDCTEAWVDLIAARPPRIDGEKDDIDKVSSILVNSNFAEQFKAIVRGALIMYGNKVFKVERLSNGQSKIVDMKLSNWIPFVDKSEPTNIQVNVFFNIVKDLDNKYICEFIEYHDNGKVVKTTFEYDRTSETLLNQLGEPDVDEAFNGIAESPIVVFTGNQMDGDILGNSLYTSWSSAIASCNRAYINMMVMLERNKESILVVPEYAGETIEGSDIRIVRRKGAIEYKEGQDHDVKWVVSDLNVQQAIDVYKESLIRLSRDTDLSISFFDARELGSQVSAKALRATMYRTELKANSRVTELERSTKELITKLALINGIALNMNEFSLITNVGFIQDDEEQMKIIQARNGNIPTMTLEDSISAYDGISMKRAKAKANELIGYTEENTGNLETEDKGNIEAEDNNITFTASDSTEENELNLRESIRRRKQREFMGRYLI